LEVERRLMRVLDRETEDLNLTERDDEREIKQLI
jgi:hypothetical protein